MKKLIKLMFTLFCILALAGCGDNGTYKIRITIPAGSTEDFIYSDEEISATGNKITISSGEGLGDTAVLLSPVDKNVEAEHAATYLTPGMPVKFEVSQDEWFKIGVSAQNDTNKDKIVYVEVAGVEVRIS